MLDIIGDLLRDILNPQFLLNWATMAVSLFNTIILLWLGLTVLLNSERKRWGVWAAGGGLLLGGAFFVAHSAMLGHGLRDVGAGMDLWWQVGWVPVVALPFAWYVVMLWYSGFWDGGETALHRRHRLLFALAALMFAGQVALFLFFNPLPSYSEFAQIAHQPRIGLTRLQLLAVFYPAYALLCMGLSLDVVSRPGPTGRLMGDLARRRARPWLAATSFVLLLVSVLIAWAIIWLLIGSRDTLIATIYNEMEAAIYWFDLVTSILVAGANVLLGQAVVSYEIFTGKTLPRRGFVRQWRSALVLALVYSAVVGASLARQPHPIAGLNGLLLTTVLMSTFFALFSWRSYAERERYIDNLRPFVTSQRLYEELLAGGAEAVPDVDAVAPFNALCRDVLGVKAAYLAAMGPLSPLAGPPLTYPPGRNPKLPPLTEITGRLESAQTMYLPLDPARWDGAVWAVPLWSERGLIGVMLLGEKLDEGLFAQEEIEIARATGERLIDAQASAQMAQRLMALQRQRLAESQVLDRRARRVLHDDVLPLLHTAMLSLMSGDGRKPGDGPASQPPAQPSIDLLADAHHRISDLLREMPPTVAPDIARLGLVKALRKAVEEDFAGAFDSVEWQVDPAATDALSDISPLSAEVVFYAAREAIRNAARYGRDNPARPLHLRVAVMWRGGLEILVEDDGVGLPLGAEAAPTSANGHAGNGVNGTMPAEESLVTPNGSAGGSGQGLALHSTMMAVVGGSLSTESVPGEYTRVVLSLPAGS
jgi:signal transduction histidine kinase